MTENERNIYLKIFDITENNLMLSGGEMVTYKETFNASLELETFSADVSLLNDIPRDKFIQALDYVFFYRWTTIVEEEAVKANTLPEKELKRELIKKAYDSTERMTAKRIVTNYIDYSEDGNRRIGKFKRNFIKMYAGIKAMIPLSVKTKIKNKIKR